MRASLAIAAACVALSCNKGAPPPEHRSAIDHGRAIFADRSASPAPVNAYACATCHRAAESASDDRVLPGATLAGAPLRATYWAGQEDDLLRAINDCRTIFMLAPTPWTADDEEAKALFAYLSSLPGDGAPAPFTVARGVVDLPAGDASAGASVFARACGGCHGEVHTGRGKLAPLAPNIPDDTLAEHSDYAPTDRRLIFIEKVRHGGFLGYGEGGAMPPFSIEALSDAELASVLSYFVLYE